MNKEFPKAYEPKNSENKWYGIWQDNNIYHADETSEKEPYSVLMPPPNVTGILHFGHVLNITLQDIYCRRKRMQNYEVCWFPGYDHAGIATHAKVEAQLKEENLTRYDLGREKFLERVWDWKEKYGGIIMKQLRWLGVSCDWDRTLFTMDDSASNAVLEVFVRLFDDGLIYRGKRIINWSPVGQTALSNEEVEFREVKEQFHTMRYYFEDSDEYIQVGTVRAETIFGDVAVAVNPKDEKRKHLIGKTVIIPLVGRKVPIIGDEHADPEFGSGFVKITPAHDPNDFMVGKRHDLDMLNTINPDGTMNELAGEYAGMDRFAARKAILKKLNELDLIEKSEDYAHNVGFSQRGGEPIEPYLSDQWFVKMKPLAEDALKTVQDGDIKFHPAHWTKTYEHWMNNIQDWCISRQLWWGQRIPVYYTEDGRQTAAITEAEARVKLNIGADVPLRQDEDVLDTWFSSWLWPLTTMNWMADGKNETSPDLEKFLSTDLLVTGPDIIFFWVARMIMATKKFKNVVPFKDVYFTSTIRDGSGKKLSKSLGNSPDPLNIIDKYGTDAIRFTIIYLSPLGQDVRMDVDVDVQDIPSMELGRNFANKIWNSGRFLLMKRDDAQNDDPENKIAVRDLKDEELTFADHWILSRFNSTVKNIDKALDNYKVNDYSKIIYEFIRRDFCNWYVEIVKVQFADSDDVSYKKALMAHVIGIYDEILMLLHPIMPFITEEIWHLLVESRAEAESISLVDMPVYKEERVSEATESKFEFVQLLVEEIRKLRSSMKISPQQKVPLQISAKTAEMNEFLNSQLSIIKSLAKCSTLEIGHDLEKPDNSMASVIRETSIYLLLEGTIDKDKERERMNKEIQRLERNIFGCEKKLSNERFVSNAPEKVLNNERVKLASMKESLIKVQENLNELG